MWNVCEWMKEIVNMRCKIYGNLFMDLKFLRLSLFVCVDEFLIPLQHSNKREMHHNKLTFYILIFVCVSVWVFCFVLNGFMIALLTLQKRWITISIEYWIMHRHLKNDTIKSLAFHQKKNSFYLGYAVSVFFFLLRFFLNLLYYSGISTFN